MAQKPRKGHFGGVKIQNITWGSIPPDLPRIGNRSVFTLDPRLLCTQLYNQVLMHAPTMLYWGAYYLTEKSSWGVKSVMVSVLPVYRRNATSITI